MIKDAKTYPSVQTGASIASNQATVRSSFLVSVIIPTFRRPRLLMMCVESILAGSRRPDEIIVVGRTGDKETEQAVVTIAAAPREGVKVCSAWVMKPGHVPPVETGLRTASGELVAVVDDDVTVTPEWLFHMVSHFSDPAIGVVGGRVLVPGAPAPKAKGRPGCISWYGKMWGNLGSLDGTTTIEVDSVMEGNWIWRRGLLTALEFDPILNFDDASMYGLDLCLQAKKRGFKVVYEPRALAYHHPAPRAPELDRHHRGPRVFCYCRNYTYIILKRFRFWRRVVFLSWWFLIGEGEACGFGSVLAESLMPGRRKRRYPVQAWRGKTEGIRLWLTQ